MPEENKIPVEEQITNLQTELSELRTTLLSSIADLNSKFEKPVEETAPAEIPKPQENNIDHWKSLFE